MPNPDPRGNRVLASILRNVFSNSAGYVINVVVAILLKPLVLEELGSEINGAWQLVVALTGHYGLLDLGIRSAVGYYVAVHAARRDTAGVQRVLGTAMVLMGIATLVSLLATGVLYLVLPLWKPQICALEPRIVPALLVMGCGFALSFPMAIFSTVLYARQRLDLQNAIGISQRLLSALLIVLALRAGAGVLGLSWVVVSCNALGWLAHFVLARRLMPEVRFAPRPFSRATVRELSGYGIFNFIVNAADSILVYSDTVIIGVFMASGAAVTYYTNASDLIPYYMQVIYSVTWAFTPYATTLYAGGDLQALQRLHLLGTRTTLLLGTLLAGGMLLLGHDLIAVWLGPEFVTENPLGSSAVVLAILSCAALMRASQSVGRQILFATQEVRFLGKLALFEAVANLVLSCLLIRWLGLAGVALGTLIPILITQGFVQPWYLARRLELRLTRITTDSLRILASVLLTMDLAYWLLARPMETRGWGSFLFKCTIVGLPALGVGMWLGLGAEERTWLRQRILRMGPPRQEADES